MARFICERLRLLVCTTGGRAGGRRAAAHSCEGASGNFASLAQPPGDFLLWCGSGTVCASSLIVKLAGACCFKCECNLSTTEFCWLQSAACTSLLRVTIAVAICCRRPNWSGSDAYMKRCANAVLHVVVCAATSADCRRLLSSVLDCGRWFCVRQEVEDAERRREEALVRLVSLSWRSLAPVVGGRGAARGTILWCNDIVSH